MAGKHCLNFHKKRLLHMFYYDASADPYACYYDIEADQDDIGIFGEGPFTVKFLPGATNLFRQDAGRYLCFTTGEPITDEQLLSAQWKEENRESLFNAFLPQSETKDVTDMFMEGMEGRDLTLFFACLLQEWIYEKLGGSLYGFVGSGGVRRRVPDLEVRGVSGREGEDGGNGTAPEGAPRPLREKHQMMCWLSWRTA